MSRRYPIEPLLAILEARGLTTNHHRILGVSSQGYRVILRSGVTEAAADRAATALGLHPAELWPDWLSELEPSSRCEECRQPFVPNVHNQRFCSRKCRIRVKARNHQRRRYQRDPAWAEKQREKSRRYYEEAGDYVRARQRRSYHLDLQGPHEKVRA